MKIVIKCEILKMFIYTRLILRRNFLRSNFRNGILSYIFVIFFRLKLWKITNLRFYNLYSRAISPFFYQIQNILNLKTLWDTCAFEENAFVFTRYWKIKVPLSDTYTFTYRSVRLSLRHIRDIFKNINHFLMFFSMVFVINLRNSTLNS